MTRVPPFIEPLAPLPEFKDQVADLFRSVFGEADALDLKTKYLIGLAIDISANLPGGVRNLAQMAREQGATDAEIMSVARICFAGSGFQKLVSSLVALQRPKADGVAAGDTSAG